MNINTLQAINISVSEANLETLFTKAFGKRKAKTMLYGNKKNEYCSDDTRYALMFNVETDELFFLNYATSENNWASVAESQNPWYVSASDIMSGAADTFLIEDNNHTIEQMQSQELENKKMYDESIYA
jgi:hypothetical protein